MQKLELCVRLENIQLKQSVFSSEQDYFRNIIIEPHYTLSTCFRALDLM